MARKERPTVDKSILITTGLNEVYRSSNQIILANEPGLLLSNGAGIILGHIFDRSITPKRVTHLRPDTTENVVVTNGQTLMSNYWGGYVGLVRGARGDVVLRDPSGQLPCYYTQTAGQWIFASDIDLLASALPKAPTVCWEALARHLASGEFRRPETCLNGVMELLAGWRIDLDDNGKITPIWSPWDYVAPVTETHSEAALRLRGVADGSISAWGSCFRAVGVSLSGGLDSSIVTAALRGQSNSLTLLNLSADDAESDERHYARMAADAVNAPLTEGFYDLDDLDFRRSTSAFLPRPVYGPLAQADLAIKHRIESGGALDAWFGGLGGDNAFCLMQSTTPVLDRLGAHGLGKGALQTLGDVMDLTGCSLWAAVTQMIRTARSFSGRYHIEPDFSLLNLHQYSTPLEFNHPWLDGPSGTPVGKTVHVAMLLRMQSGNDGYDRLGVPLISPLLSQPIMETCLSVPSWVWCAGGHNRSLARRAYEGILPEALVFRRSKGGPSRFAYKAVDANQAVIRDLLLGGSLAERGIIDVPAITSATELGKPVSSRHYVRLAQLAEAETWARHWQ